MGRRGEYEDPLPIITVKWGRKQGSYAENTGFSITLALSCSHTLIQIRDVTVPFIVNSLWYVCGKNH